MDGAGSGESLRKFKLPPFYHDQRLISQDAMQAAIMIIAVDASFELLIEIISVVLNEENRSAANFFFKIYFNS